MLKKYLLVFILVFIVFGCKRIVSQEGVLIYRKDLPFRNYAEGRKTDIFLKTSKSDTAFPDGIRYFAVHPKDKYYQDFINNMGRKVRVRGEEYVGITRTDVSIDNDFVPREDVYFNIYTYWLDKAKIIKVLD